MPEVFQGKVDRVVHGGDGIVRHDGQSVFIPNTVAGDAISYHITDKKRGALRGKLVDVIAPSQDRVSPPCPVFDECGGCALQTMSVAAQAKLKTSWVNHAFQAFITHDSEIIAAQAEQQNFAGRRRVRWFTDHGKLGFRKRLSHQVIHTTHCMALTPQLDDLRNHLENMMLPTSVQSIQAVALSNGIHIILESEQSCPTDFTPVLEPNQQWWWRKLGSPSIKALHKPVLTLFDSIDLSPFLAQDIQIKIGPNDFVQGHARGNQQLISQILAWSQDAKRVVDLFSGCGNLSLPLAALGKEVFGAELSESSVQAANNNAKHLGVNASYQSLDLFGKFDIEPFIGADTLILDPPRKGAKRICQHIHQLFPKQVIMVHCDVASGARDAKSLHDAGFKLKALRTLDLFPFAGHVESLSLWSS